MADEREAINHPCERCGSMTPEDELCYSATDEWLCQRCTRNSERARQTWISRRKHTERDSA